jgi:ubiquinone biosynthesis protein
VWFLILAGACALVVAMVFLVVAEALVPSGSVPGPLELRRMLRGRLARARRYSQISRIAVRHGLGPYLRGRRRAELDTPDGRERLARSVRLALEEAGVTFVKLGQVLSTRPDLLPAEFVEELGRLTDHVAPAPWDEVEQVLAAELGRPVEEVFADFDRRPLAAASVAQVHAARLRSGALQQDHRLPQQPGHDGQRGEPDQQQHDQQQAVGGRLTGRSGDGLAGGGLPAVARRRTVGAGHATPPERR